MIFITVFLTALCVVPSELVLLNETLYKQSNIPEEGTLNFQKRAAKYNLPFEEHDVITEDKYILKVFRVPPQNQSKGLPIILLHGILDTAETFLLRGNTSLVNHLASKDADVWVGNVRGNRYGRRHLTLDPDVDKEFWAYSTDEHGYYDYAAIVDYVLSKTGKPKVDIIAHSQGTCSTFILCSSRPEYNDKINVHIALSPITSLKHVKGLILALAAIGPPLIEGFFATGIVELLNEKSTLRRFIQDVCSQEGGYQLCAEGIVFPTVGRNPEEFEPDFFPIFLGRYFDATSTQNINHYLQTIHQRRFAKYDYGPAKNLRLYGSIQSPLYDLTKVTSQVVLMVGKNDYLGPPEDEKPLLEVLPKAEYFEMPPDDYNHIDFVWGKHMPQNLFPYIDHMLNKYSLKT